jgi:hypothetical protein
MPLIRYDRIGNMKIVFCGSFNLHTGTLIFKIIFIFLISKFALKIHGVVVKWIGMRYRNKRLNAILKGELQFLLSPPPVSAGKDLRGRKEERKNGNLLFVKRFDLIL